MEYLDYALKHMIHIDDANLIKPEDIEKHIGEVLMFHNGRGYIVSGILTEAKADLDEYSFANRYSGLEYEYELNMGMYYYPEHIMSIHDTVEYAMMVVVNHIAVDEMMHNIRYIAKATDEEIAFRNKMLTYDEKWFKKNYKTIKKMLNKYNDREEKLPKEEWYKWDILSDDDKLVIDKILNKA